MLNHIVNVSVSCFKTARFDTHGQYNSENIKKLIALALVRKTALDVRVKLSINSFVDVVLLQTESVETISSFAITPTISAQTTPALFSPIGANKKEILPLKTNKMLSLILSVYFKVKFV